MGMRLRKVSGLVLSVLCVLNAQGAVLENWAQWRGPLGTGEGPKADPPVKWSATENIKWKVKVPGRGTGTPVIWGDQIFLLTAIPTGKKVAEYPSEVPGTILAAQQQNQNAQGQERQGRPRGGGGGGGRSEKPTEEQQFVLLCLDRKTGKTMWQQTARQEVPHEGHHQDHTFASASALTDGEQVFAFFGSRGLYAYDMNGKLQWSKDFGDQSTRNNFGEGSSPAVHKDTIVVNWDHEGEDFVVALNKKTGEELWRQGRDEATSWSTPLIVEHNGQAQVVIAASKSVKSYDLKTGKVIWECTGLTGNVIPTPIYHDGMVYVTSGFRGNALLAIKLGRSGNLDDTDAIVWKHGKGTPYVPTPVLIDGKLFVTSHNNPIISCFDAKTGKAVFEEERLTGPQGLYASPVAAKDRVYIVGRNGTTSVIKKGEKLEVLATNPLGEKVDASPALVGEDLFIRGHEHLFCIAD